MGGKIGELCVELVVCQVNAIQERLFAHVDGQWNDSNGMLADNPSG